MSRISPSIRAHGVGFAYGASPALFEGLTFHLGPGLTGLVGGNGAGKTTLLGLLRGALPPTSGHLQRDPEGARRVWCPQGVEDLDEAVREFEAAGDRLARRLRGTLRLEADQAERWSTLSPGERKRWQLGAALWREPAFAFFDEPSNHLDSEGVQLLREALRSFRGCGVIVSHDRALLDDVTQATLRLHSGEASLLGAPYSEAQARWQSEASALREAQRLAQRRLQTEERQLDERRRTLEAASRQRGAGARMKDRHDSDQRTSGANFRAESAERAHAAALRRVERQAEAARHRLERLVVRDDPGQRLYVQYEPCPRPTVVQLRQALFAPNGRRLASEVSLQVGRHEHVWVRGPNGCGKTTLINEVLRQTSVPAERLLLLPQELSATEVLTDLEALRALSPQARGRVLQLVHALGVEPEVLLRTTQPSPGEGRKLRLALGLGRHAWLAVLDEPTNHLDLPSIENLEAALRQFPGAMLLITHDERLGAAVTSRTLPW